MSVEWLVFSDDWGRHPSSCQHLVRQLLPKHPVAWVNTIGTRLPKLDWHTVKRASEKIVQWTARPAADTSAEANPRVLAPVMWPSFRTSLCRRINRNLLTTSLCRQLDPNRTRVGVTTIPLAADLADRLPVDRWIYYCVDDLAEWPGLDKPTLLKMERDLVCRADAIVAVSDRLVERMESMGRSSTLLTHGVDLDHWRSEPVSIPDNLRLHEEPRIVFWGVVDRRMNADWVKALSQRLVRGTIVLAGPVEYEDPTLNGLPNVVRLGPVPYADLPSLAQSASVLVMPYADSPATRAMQPLKLKEYLATGKPVVVSDLPAVRDWQSACDVATTASEFVHLVTFRLEKGVPESQRSARCRLNDESWTAKAKTFEEIVLEGIRETTQPRPLIAA